MCGGWLGEAISDVGKAVEENVTKPVVGAVKDAGDFIQEEVIDPVKEFGSSLEDAVRDAADDVNKVIENPYVQMIVSAINPAAGAVLNSYATLNSGDELSAGQIAALATAGITQGNITITPELQKAINVGTTVADGGSVEDALVSAYGGNFAKKLGLDTKVKDSLSGFVGSDFAQRISKNVDFNQAAADYVAGNSTERILANQFGDEVVGYLGAETPTQQALGFAGIESLVSKAEGASDEDALLAGAKTYYDRGGRLPDVGEIASVAGFGELPEFDYNRLIGDLNLDFGALKGQYDLPSLRDFGIDLNKLNIQVPDLLENVNLDLPQIADLGLDLGNLNFSGYSTEDLGIDAFQLKDLGVDLGQLNLDPELFKIGLALATETIPGSQVTSDGEEIASLESEFDISPSDEPLFSREVLGRSFT